jgi:hypothetical protein
MLANFNLPHQKVHVSVQLFRRLFSLLLGARCPAITMVMCAMIVVSVFVDGFLGFLSL